MTVVGDRFNWLTVLEMGHRGRTHQFWKCRCDCGTIRLFRANKVKDGSSKSCGCGLSRKRNPRGRNPARAAWRGMMERCYNQEVEAFKDYGGRGITICERWHDIELFVVDIGPKPSPTHSIDRIDNDGPYSPENCRWATRKVQNRNKRSNRRETYAGETKVLQDWADQYNLPWYVLRDRLERAWGMERALTTPVQRKSKPQKENEHGNEG